VARRAQCWPDRGRDLDPGAVDGVDGSGFGDLFDLGDASDFLAVLAVIAFALILILFVTTVLIPPDRVHDRADRRHRALLRRPRRPAAVPPTVDGPRPDRRPHVPPLARRRLSQQRRAPRRSRHGARQRPRAAAG